MKVKVIECKSFTDFLDVMHHLADAAINQTKESEKTKVGFDETNANNNTSTEATNVSSKKKTKKKLKKVPKCIEAYIRILSQKHGYSFKEMKEFLADIEKVSLTAVYNILAKQVAITIDKVKYEDHISNSKKLFVINLYDGNVYEVKSPIKNLNLIPVFRTKEDAELAREILKPLLDEMF